MVEERFSPVQLTFSVGKADPDKCNPGGSYICDTPTKGCAKGVVETTCIGTSCPKGNSVNFVAGLTAEVHINETERNDLQSELAIIIAKFSK